MLCPNCERNSIKSIGDNQLFCLDCDWDDLSELSEIGLTTPGPPFLPGLMRSVRPAANDVSSRTEHDRLTVYPTEVLFT